eukprot:3537290-Amphidinium_carterae.1
MDDDDDDDDDSCQPHMVMRRMGPCNADMLSWSHSYPALQETEVSLVHKDFVEPSPDFKMNDMVYAYSPKVTRP